MNGNPRQSLWVLALGIAITGFYTSNVSAAAPARQEPGQQDWDHDRNQNPDRNDEQRGERWSFQQACGTASTIANMAGTGAITSNPAM